MSNPRPIKRHELLSIIGKKKRYKLTKGQENKEGFYSVIAGTGSYPMFPCLEYAQGRVTDAPVNTYIYTYDSLDKARTEARRLGTSKARSADIRYIFEVLPVGKMRPNRKLNEVTMCRAVLIGKEVAKLARFAPDEHSSATSTLEVVH